MTVEQIFENYDLNMYETKENLKYYAIKIKLDYKEYIGNKNIDCGNT